MNNTPSIRSANWLYLLSMVLILTVGTLIQGFSFGWGLFGTEILLILLPTLIFLAINKLPVHQTLSLQWPGWKQIVLGLMIGTGLWLVDSMLDVMMILIFGYSPPTVPDMYPTTFSQAILIFISLALAPAFCEEVLFRGYIQRAYEGIGHRMTIVIPAFMFMIFHFRLQGLIALFPIAFTLGYLRAHSKSLWPGVAAHFANNSMAAISLAIAGLKMDWLSKLPIGTIPAFIAGVVLAGVSLMLFSRLTKPQEREQPAISPDRPHFTFGAVLPLLIAGLLYVTLARFEWILGRMPDMLATGELALGDPPWQDSVSMNYEIRNALNEQVGETSCDISYVDSGFTLDCQTHVSAFKVELPGSTFQSGNYRVDLALLWAEDGLTLAGGEVHADYDGAIQETKLTASEGGVVMEVQDSEGMQSLSLPENALMPDEWAWRLMALPFSVGLNQKAQYAYPSFWDQETQTNHPAVKEISIVVTGAEPLTLPAGNFIAWRVQVDNWTVWYDVKAPHILLKYDAGFATYLLADKSEEFTP